MPLTQLVPKLGRICLLLMVVGVFSFGLTAAPAQAADGCDKLPTGVLSTICSVGGTAAGNAADAAKKAAETAAGAAICSKLPSQALQLACKSKVGTALINGDNPATAGAKAATSEVKAIGGGLSGLLNPVSAILKGMAAAVAEGASWFLERIGDVIFKTTSPNLMADWFTASYARMLILGTMVLAPTLIYALLAAYMRHDNGEIARIMRCALLALVVLPSAPKIVQAVVKFSDELGQGAMWATGNHGDDFVKTVTGALGQASVFSSGPVAVIGIAAFLMLLGGFTVWLELFIRDAMIVSITFFLAISMIPLILKDSRKGVTWLLKVLGVAIFAKPLMVAMLGLSELLMTSSGDGAGQLTAILIGAIMMVMVFFAPMAFFKVIAPMFGSVAVEAMQHRASLSNVRSAAGNGAAARTSGSVLSRVVSASKGMGKGGATKAIGSAGGGAGSAAATGAGAAATGGALLAAKGAQVGAQLPGRVSRGAANRLSGLTGTVAERGSSPSSSPAAASQRPLIRPVSVERVSPPRTGGQPTSSRPPVARVPMPDTVGGG